MNVLEEDLHEIVNLPLVTKVSKGRVSIPELKVAQVYDNDFNDLTKLLDEPVIILEYADEVYVYENSLGAQYACFMSAGRYRYYARITVGVEVIITEEGITNV